MTTLNEIARRAGVGRGTASRVINNSSGVSEKKRLKVMEAVKYYGYRPNIAARNLKKSFSPSLAIVIPCTHIGDFLSHQVNAEKIEGLTTTAVTLGLQLSIIPDQLNHPEQMKKILYDQGFDGIFLLAPTINEESLFNFFEQFSVKVLLVNWQAASREIPFVATDYHLAAEMALDHLATAGCRRFAVFNNSSPVYPERLFQHIKELNGSFVPKDFMIYEHASDPQMAKAFWEEYLKRPPELRPDGIYASSNYMAASLLEIASEKKIICPRDFKLIALDDMAIAEYTNPKLSRLKQQCKKIGELALHQMVKLLKGEWEEGKLLMPEFIKRESC
jgi:DNA-binding LacI/PurR family transcriptional regulator